MGLITKSVKIKWNGFTKQYYEKLGYKYTKIGDEFEVRVEDLQLNSTIKVQCICDGCGEVLPPWKYQNYNRSVKEDGKTYCNKCAMKLYGRESIRKTKLKNGKSFYDWCIENNRQDVLDRWDYDLNGCSPKDISYSTHNKYWFKCDIHPQHKSELKNIHGFVEGYEGCMDCKQCNSIAQYILDNFPNKKLEEVWDYEKNGDLDPWNISRGSSKKIYIFCQEKDYHRSYETTSKLLLRGARCSYCGNHKVHPLDSLGQYIVDEFGEEFLKIIWSDKNTFSPFEIKPNSTIMCWWNCPEGKHEEYRKSANNMVTLEFRCSECVKDRKESLLEEKTRLYLKNINYEVKTEYKCSLLIRNPKKDIRGRNNILPFDNEIVLENGKHLIIEVHGKQHYKIGTYTRTKEELHQRKLYDRYKRIKCIQAGYEYLEIPYTAFDNKDTYKKLIDNKIKEILES